MRFISLPEEIATQLKPRIAPVSAALTALLMIAGMPAPAQNTQANPQATVVVEPYAANIVRVSISLLRPYAEAGPGYGIVAKPSDEGWSRQSTPQGQILRSPPRMVVTTSVSSGNYKPTGHTG